MRALSEESASKLEKILTKKLGRNLSRKEVEEAYNSLMDFAYAVMQMDIQPVNKSKQMKLNKL
jgi:hypothetical protein